MGKDQLNQGSWNLFFTVLCAKKGMDVPLLISDVCHAWRACQTVMNYPLEELFPTYTNILRPTKLRMV